MTQRFVSLGECMVELAPAGEGNKLLQGFAGDTLNTAWYMRKLLRPDWQVDYVTCVGSDAISGKMLEFFQNAGLNTDHVKSRKDSTVGLYLITLDNGERSFSYWRSDSAAKRLCQDPGLVPGALQDAAVAYFSGITLGILSAADRAILLDHLRTARAAGVEIVFDPNLRPALWDSPQTMCTATMQAAEVADVVLPSYDDEASFFGDADLKATAERYAKCGSGLVVVKNGGAEMLTLDRGAFAAHVSTAPEAIVDTTAAGDSFNAGFLATRAQGGALAEAMRGGADLAAKVIAHRGALVQGIAL
ncbi:sugar kinase [Fluviibacterium sp. S390]|uniref:sugar kinase n=1 Tax=Fluviibacterium sp. S390 TaxID=3415139 RepID=UPI003C7D492E